VSQGDGFALIERARLAAAGDPDICAVLDRLERWVMDGVQDGRHRRAEGYLGIPATPARCRRWLRDGWLARAAAHIDATGEWAGCVQLAEEWETFQTRGGWSAWRDLKEPPPELTSELRRALFYASRFHDGRPALGATGLFAIDRVRSTFRARN